MIKVPIKAPNSEYIKRINRVLDYLAENYQQEHDLASVAELANFSKYHFHRIFKGVVGEPLNKYIQRIRIEKAAHRLKYHAKKSITEIAIDCGFNNSASFSRAFNSHFGVSATAWRNGAHLEFSKNRKQHSNNGDKLSNNWQDADLSAVYIDDSTRDLMWNINMLNRKDVKVEIKNIDQINVAYLRHIGPFIGETKTWGRLFNQLINWGAARGLINCSDTKYFTVFRDELEITDFSKFKADICISVAAGTKGDSGISISHIAGGKYAVAQFEIDADEYEQAWQLVYSEWLPKSGFQPDERCCFERYLNDPKTHPNNKHILEIHIPVKAL